MLMKLVKRYSQQEQSSKYHLHDGRGSEANQWDTTVQVLKQHLGEGHAVVRRFITNCPAVAEDLKDNEHSPASINLALQNQQLWDISQRVIMHMVKTDDLHNDAQRAEERVLPEGTMDFEPTAWGDVSGNELDTSNVREARELEMEYYSVLHTHRCLRPGAIGGDGEGTTQGALDRRRQGAQVSQPVGGQAGQKLRRPEMDCSYTAAQRPSG